MKAAGNLVRRELREPGSAHGIPLRIQRGLRPYPSQLRNEVSLVVGGLSLQFLAAKNKVIMAEECGPLCGSAMPD